MSQIQISLVYNRKNKINKNEELLKVINHVKEENSSLHLVGLLSDGGVHSHINHLFSLLELTKKEGLKKAEMDGR